jgi:hypothetical protein
MIFFRTEKLEEPVFMSSVCVLKRSRPEFVIYQDLFETTKILMRGKLKTLVHLKIDSKFGFD